MDRDQKTGVQLPTITTFSSGNITSEWLVIHHVSGNKLQMIQKLEYDATFNLENAIHVTKHQCCQHEKISREQYWPNGSTLPKTFNNKTLHFVSDGQAVRDAMVTRTGEIYSGNLNLGLVAFDGRKACTSSFESSIRPTLRSNSVLGQYSSSSYGKDSKHGLQIRYIFLQ